MSISDAETRETIAEVFEKFRVMLEPHGAVGWAGLMRYLNANPKDTHTAICLETAHPAKFPDEVKKASGEEPKAPQSLIDVEKKTERYDTVEVRYDAFKAYLKGRYGK